MKKILIAIAILFGFALNLAIAMDLAKFFDPPLGVFYGHLVKVFVDDSELPLVSRTEKAVYTIREIERGNFMINTNDDIYVMYCASSVRGSLPEDAILLLSDLGANNKSYEVLGEEVWRGILPDTPENRARIKATPTEVLKKTPPGKEISESKAREMAKSATIDYIGGYNITVEGIKFKTVKRRPFGWFISMYLLVLNNGQESIDDRNVQINDEGHVVHFGNNGFPYIMDISSWDSLSEAPVPEE